jgi:hypothetical protein
LAFRFSTVSGGGASVSFLKRSLNLETLLKPAFIIVAFKLASSLDELVMLGFCNRLSSL